MALAVDKRFFAEENVTVAMVGDLMALADDALHELRTVDGTAEAVLFKGRVVVVGRAAPGRCTRCAGSVGVVVGGDADDVKGALGVELREGVQQHIRQTAAVKEVRRCRQTHRPVVKGHGADPLRGLDPLDAAAVGHAAFWLGQQDGFGKTLHFLSQTDKGAH